MRSSDPLPAAVGQYFRASGTGRVLDHRQSMLLRGRQYPVQVARHPDLMHAKDRPRPGRDRGIEKLGIEIEGIRFDIDEARLRTKGADAIGSGDERMTDGHDLVARADTDRAQAQASRAAVQLETAQALAAPTAVANSRSKASTSRPWVIQPDSTTARAASPSTSSSRGLAIGITVQTDASPLAPVVVRSATSPPDGVVPRAAEFPTQSRASAAPSPRRRGAARPGSRLAWPEKPARAMDGP